MEENKGWHNRGYLPHYDAGDVTQFITFRLGDSLPYEVLIELEHLRHKGIEGMIERQNRLEYYLDQGSGSCILREPECATIVQNALKFLDGSRYELKARVIMPNHVHFLARFNQGQPLWKAMHSLKSFTSNELGKLHPDVRPIWQEESFDRFIRSEEHFSHVIRYIHQNPVEAGICKSPDEFRWSSAFVEAE